MIWFWSFDSPIRRSWLTFQWLCACTKISSCFTMVVFIIRRFLLSLQPLFILYNAHELLYNVCLFYTWLMSCFYTFAYLIRRLCLSFHRLSQLQYTTIVSCFRTFVFLYNVYLSYTTFWFIQQRLPCFSYRSKEITLGLAEELKVLVKEV